MVTPRASALRFRAPVAWLAVVALLVLAACGESSGEDPGAPDAADGASADTARQDVFADTSGSGAEPDADAAPDVPTEPPDGDEDGVPDQVDNCPAFFNPDQYDVDEDGTGDLCDDVQDLDRDGVPDHVDAWPGDANLPGTAVGATVYAHTASRLYTMNVKTYQVVPVGDFAYPGGTDDVEMTDIAIDRWGVLYGVTRAALYTCHPQTAACAHLAALPDQFNGLTWVHEGVLEPDREVLVGVAIAGGWFRLDVQGGQVIPTKVGAYGGPYSSSGDAFSIAGVGTFASLNQANLPYDVIAEITPETGAVFNEVAYLDGLDQVWGVAGWTERVFGFDADGTIVVIDLSDGGVTVLQESGIPWWGAGVKTRL